MGRQTGLATALAVLASASAIAAGCGDDGGDATAIDDPAVRGALQECLDEIHSDTENGDAPISKADRAEYAAACRSAAEDGIPELKETTKQVCKDIVESTVPKGALVYVQSLEQCRNGTRP